MDAVAGKIRRIRGGAGPISPSWALPPGAPAAARDVWLRRLLIGAAACFLFMLLLFVSFKLILGSGASDVRTIATQGRI